MYIAGRVGNELFWGWLLVVVMRLLVDWVSAADKDGGWLPLARAVASAVAAVACAAGALVMGLRQQGMAGVSPGHKKYPGRGGVFVSGGVGVGGLWRARLPLLPRLLVLPAAGGGLGMSAAASGVFGVGGCWWCVCACRGLFHLFSAMFFYMYENMAGCVMAGRVFGGAPSTQVQTIRRHNRMLGG